MATFSAWDYVVLVIMLMISAGIGLYYRFTGGKQKTTKVQTILLCNSLPNNLKLPYKSNNINKFNWKIESFFICRNIFLLTAAFPYIQFHLV